MAMQVLWNVTMRRFVEVSKDRRPSLPGSGSPIVPTLLDSLTLNTITLILLDHPPSHTAANHSNWHQAATTANSAFVRKFTFQSRNAASAGQCAWSLDWLLSYF